MDVRATIESDNFIDEIARLGPLWSRFAQHFVMQFSVFGVFRLGTTVACALPAKSLMATGDHDENRRKTARGPCGCEPTELRIGCLQVLVRRGSDRGRV
jgi:hypothetical protein